jgi:hypothetical protein
MDAWANISHFLDYKSSKEVPKELRKDFYALSGLFYLAVTHFELFYDARQNSKRNYQEIMKTETNFVGQEINLDNLKAYFDIKYPKFKKTEIETISELLTEFHNSGYTTLDKLDKDITQAEPAFKEYEKEHPPFNDKFYQPAGIVRCSLAIINKKFRDIRYHGDETYSNYEKYIKI